MNLSIFIRSFDGVHARQGMRRARCAGMKNGMIACVCVALGIGLGGCAEHNRAAHPDATTMKPAPATMPSYVQIAQRFDTRVARLNRVWSRVNLTLRQTKESGKQSVDRAEGYLQLIQPAKTALSVNKLGETYFYFGSDEKGYWWLDLSDTAHKVALYGTLAMATPARVGALGLPVHPRELLDLLAITPLPESGSVSWDGLAGQFVVRTAGAGGAWGDGGEWGDRKVWLEKQTLAPRRVELLDRNGSVRAMSTFEKYISVPVKGDGHVPPKMASRYRINLPGEGVELILELYGATNKAMSDRAFDFAELVDAYGVDEIIDLDTQVPQETSSPAHSSVGKGISTGRGTSK